MRSKLSGCTVPLPFFLRLAYDRVRLSQHLHFARSDTGWNEDDAIEDRFIDDHVDYLMAARLRPHGNDDGGSPPVFAEGLQGKSTTLIELEGST